MDPASIIKELHPLEIKLLLHVNKGEDITAQQLITRLSYNLGQCNQAFSWLAAKGLIKEKERKQVNQYEMTELGREYFDKGTPEERVIELLKEAGACTLPELAQKLGIENKDIGSAYGQLAKEDVLTMDEQKRVTIKDLSRTTRLKQTRELLNFFKDQDTIAVQDLSKEMDELASSMSKKRGASTSAFKILEREEVTYILADDGLKVKNELAKSGLTGEEIGVLTPDLLKSGEWQKKGFRAYNLKMPPVRVMLGRKNPYVDYLMELKDKLVSLGFEEFDGPLVETEFWNSDALFMPQFHAARGIHDIFYVKEPTHAREIPQPYLNNVAATHENGWQTGSRGWRYPFDRDFTRRLMLRSQGTVLSAKALAQAKIPGKYFGVVRCFRPDTVDATHSADFYQTEGIVLGDDVNLRTLMGLLKIFAEEVAGAKEVRYVPAYFPFTEPSVEVHIKHPVLGWMELGGSGIFRPEVTGPMGVKVPVLAWGLGIDRMAMMSLGLNDLRDLFTGDIEQVRLRRKK
jgi:phenylalanyl-tRNA synthetase alpha chain